MSPSGRRDMREQTRRCLQFRPVPDARDIAGELEQKSTHLALGAAAHHPCDPMDRIFFNIIATCAEFEAGLIRMPPAHGDRPGKGKFVSGWQIGRDSGDSPLFCQDRSPSCCSLLLYRGDPQRR